MTTTTRKSRDLRLDFFRGMTMFIIFIAHADINPLNEWIPAAFGFSSGAEVFVFCSGLASALAFGSVFVRRGFGMGAIRVGYRIWQIYWAHFAVALAVIALMVKAHAIFPALQLEPLPEFAADPQGALIGLATLTWLPGYLDILPMYLALLALVPVMMAMRTVHRLGPMALSVLLYASAWIYGINFPGNPWNGASWYFNPFAWQLIFFTGFSFGMGWLPAPALRRRGLMLLCWTVVIVSVPITYWWFHEAVPPIGALYHFLLPPNEKSDLHVLRYLHFLAVAYLALSLIEPHREKLVKGVNAAIVGVGQQSLAVFLTSLFFARVASVVFQVYGTGLVVAVIVNTLGAALIFGAATFVRWIKSTPWKKENRNSPSVIPKPERLPAAEVSPA